jgi:hypothetical protein
MRASLISASIGKGYLPTKQEQRAQTVRKRSHTKTTLLPVNPSHSSQNLTSTDKTTGTELFA